MRVMHVLYIREKDEKQMAWHTSSNSSTSTSNSRKEKKLFKKNTISTTHRCYMHMYYEQHTSHINISPSIYYYLCFMYTILYRNCQTKMMARGPKAKTIHTTTFTHIMEKAQHRKISKINMYTLYSARTM